LSSFGTKSSQATSMSCQLVISEKDSIRLPTENKDLQVLNRIAQHYYDHLRDTLLSAYEGKYIAIDEHHEYRIYDSEAAAPFQRVPGHYFYDTVIGHEDEFMRTHKTKKKKAKSGSVLPLLGTTPVLSVRGMIAN